MKSLLNQANNFFSEVDAGRFTIVTSAIVEAQIVRAEK